jgi:hypothetical protein
VGTGLVLCTDGCDDLSLPTCVLLEHEPRIDAGKMMILLRIDDTRHSGIDKSSIDAGRKENGESGDMNPPGGGIGGGSNKRLDHTEDLMRTYPRRRSACRVMVKKITSEIGGAFEERKSTMERNSRCDHKCTSGEASTFVDHFE